MKKKAEKSTIDFHTIQVVLQKSVFRKLKTKVQLKNMMGMPIGIPDEFVSLVVNAIQKGQTSVVISLKETARKSSRTHRGATRSQHALGESEPSEGQRDVDRPGRPPRPPHQQAPGKTEAAPLRDANPRSKRPVRKRCISRESGGHQCELRSGHKGNHSCAKALKKWMKSRYGT